MAPFLCGCEDGPSILKAIGGKESSSPKDLAKSVDRLIAIGVELKRIE